MPKKLTEEQKRAAFDAWQSSDEWSRIFSFANGARNSVIPLELSVKDITDNWSTFLNELFDLGSMLKIPGRKVKSYEQKYLRTMFLEKCEKKIIDGVTYDITNNTSVEIWNCKSVLVDVYLALDPSMFDVKVTPDSYIAWKKDLVKALKEWDKVYTKHIKSGFVEMNAIHTAAMKPLTDLMESNLNLHFLELQMQKRKDIPAFRFEALEEKFAGHLTRICDIFRDYGELKEQYNIKQMLKILKIESWQEHPPLEFYLSPLQMALTDMRQCLLKMHQEGVLHCKYIIEDNEELQKKTILMVQKDLTAQWLAGDELKQDQFKFMYHVMKIIYDSALRDLLLSENEDVLNNVLPSLAAYEALLIIKNIFDTKDAEKKKEQEKLEREGALSMRKTETLQMEQAVQQPIVEQKSIPAHLLKKNQSMLLQQSQVDIRSELEKEKEAEREEIKKYGRMWIWEQYFNEGKKEIWISAAEKLRRINPHVLQDIEDYILLQGFRNKKLAEVKRIIEQDLHTRRALQRDRTREQEEEEKKMDKKRAFVNSFMKPPECWNFFLKDEEDGEEIKLPHVLRAEAQPQKCYIDGRVDSVLDDIHSLGFHLTRHEDIRWKTLRNFTLEIFKIKFHKEMNPPEEPTTGPGVQRKTTA